MEKGLMITRVPGPLRQFYQCAHSARQQCPHVLIIKYECISTITPTLNCVCRNRRNLSLSIKANQSVCSSIETAAAFIIQSSLIFVYM